MLNHFCNIIFVFTLSFIQLLLDFSSLLCLQILTEEIDEMILIVDKNGDGKISYSEFRVMMGAFPLLMDWELALSLWFNLVMVQVCLYNYFSQIYYTFIIYYTFVAIRKDSNSNSNVFCNYSLYILYFNLEEIKWGGSDQKVFKRLILN